MGADPSALGLVLVLAAGALASACEAPGPGAELERRRPQAPLEVPAAETDFGRLTPGDTIAGLRVAAIDVRPDPGDGFGWMGTVEYSGDVTLAGRYGPHFDFPEVREICFFADDSSGARLPRFPNDVRRSWLCFSNQEEAARMLGEPGSSGRARVRIGDFEYQYRHTDVYNLGRLISAERLPDSSATPSPPEEPRR